MAKRLTEAEKIAAVVADMFKGSARDEQGRVIIYPTADKGRMVTSDGTVLLSEGKVGAFTYRSLTGTPVDARDVMRKRSDDRLTTIQPATVAPIVNAQGVKTGELLQTPAPQTGKKAGEKTPVAELERQALELLRPVLEKKMSVQAFRESDAYKGLLLEARVVSEITALRNAASCAVIAHDNTTVKAFASAVKEAKEEGIPALIYVNSKGGVATTYFAEDKDALKAYAGITGRQATAKEIIPLIACIVDDGKKVLRHNAQ